MSAIKPPKMGSALRSDIITLEIGPESVKYYVHKALLVYHSEYFRNALKGPWKEAEDGVIKLVDVQPSAVNVFMHWLYVQDLPHQRDFEGWYEILGWECQPDICMAMIYTYVFADRSLVPVLRRAINKRIVDFFITGYADNVLDIPKIAVEAFSMIPADRPCLQLLVDEFCNWWTDCCDDSDSPVDLTETHPAFLARSVRKLSSKLIYAKAGDGEQECCYYEHTDEQEASACGKLHMRYDGKRDTGVFGKPIPCHNYPGGSRDVSPASSDEE